MAQAAHVAAISKNTDVIRMLMILSESNGILGVSTAQWLQVDLPAQLQSSSLLFRH
jgi:hypothetical protein